MSISAMLILSNTKVLHILAMIRVCGTLVASISGNSFTRGGLDDLQTYWYWDPKRRHLGQHSDWIGPMSGVTKTTEIPLITETMIADDAISTPKLQTNAVTSD